MRYTTIIDVTQCPDIYRNIKARLLYLHMVLNCGYHDNDKGLVRKSVRQLAEETGITKSATEHALRQLVRWQLARRTRGKLYVVNWWPEQPITKPKRKAQEVKEQAIALEREAKNREREAEVQRSKENVVSYEEYLALKNARKS